MKPLFSSITVDGVTIRTQEPEVSSRAGDIAAMQERVATLCCKQFEEAFREFSERTIEAINIHLAARQKEPQE